MKNSIYTLLLFIAPFFILISCNKPVYKYNSNFEGTWRTMVGYDSLMVANVQSEIVIEGAEGSFKNTCRPCGTDLCNCVSTYYGKAVMNSTKTQMKIGSSNLYPLNIDKEPTDSAGVWTMKIQGLTYYRQ